MCDSQSKSIMKIFNFLFPSTRVTNQKIKKTEINLIE